MRRTRVTPATGEPRGLAAGHVPPRGLNARFDAWLRRTLIYADQTPPPARDLPAEPHRRDEHPRMVLAGVTLGVALPVLTAAALTPLRTVLAPSTAALILVLPVVLVALTAGFVPGATAAVTTALAFDFFLTVPYYSPTIEAAEDVESAAVLLLIALIVSQIVAREVDARGRSNRRLEELSSFRQVANAVARRDNVALQDVATAAVGSLLGVECRWAPGYHGTASPVLQRDGRVTGQRDAAVLPANTELPVTHHGIELGRLLLRSHATQVISKEERQVAIAIADLLGSGLSDQGSES